MRMRWMSVVVLAVSMLMVGCGGAPVKPANYGEEAQAAYERAERALDRGEYEGARNLLTEIFGAVRDVSVWSARRVPAWGSLL